MASPRCVALLSGGLDSMLAIRILQEQGVGVPSSSSADHGRPFIEIFRQYDSDFYKIDPLLFSPARVCLISTRSGNRFVFGELANDILATSFSASPDSS